MPYIQRNRQGEIVSLHREPLPGAAYLPTDHPEVQAFVGRPGAPREGRFTAMDADFVRVIEDVIDVLVARNVIRITDLPSEAQYKLFARKNFRDGFKRNSLQLYAEAPPVAIEVNAVPTDMLANPFEGTATLSQLGLRDEGDDDRI
ncbi:MAG: hypothetical protein RIQ60_1740 [Pseudomonadota bacterium]